jgi:trk system potassium uptake protein TrkH
VHPAIVNPVKVGGSPIPNNVVIAVLGFIFLYFMSVVMLTFLLILSGLDFISALGAVVGSITNAGPGLGVVGPSSNYAGLTDFQTWVCSFTMLLGRLEVLSLAVVFTPQFWRK